MTYRFILPAALLISTSLPALAAETGVAAYYSDVFQGRTTACGDRYDKHTLSAAHRTLPCGTKVRVTNLDNGRRVEVVINDRGPYSKRRIIDLSRRAAEELGFIKKGLTKVRLEVLSKPQSK